jgi:hypothetical protein
MVENRSWIRDLSLWDFISFTVLHEISQILMSIRRHPNLDGNVQKVQQVDHFNKLLKNLDLGRFKKIKKFKWDIPLIVL